jgi:hypothetical protein
MNIEDVHVPRIYLRKLQVVEVKSFLRNESKCSIWDTSFVWLTPPIILK